MTREEINAKQRWRRKNSPVYKKWLLKLSAMRNERYRTDAEYREKCKAAARIQYQKKKQSQNTGENKG